MGDPAPVAVQSLATALIMRRPRRTSCESGCNAFSRRFSERHWSLGLNLKVCCISSSASPPRFSAPDSWLCSHSIGSNVTAHSQAWKEITETYNTLADYNNGLLCAAPRWPSVQGESTPKEFPCPEKSPCITGSRKSLLPLRRRLAQSDDN